ncbi:MAG: hypothetical protein DME25_09020 [Verrucomicrobia bacterium]|nr:MAG: hypothetical protein DME25_09020 [Verrucomicrobiota bacterium]
MILRNFDTRNRCFMKGFTGCKTRSVFSISLLASALAFNAFVFQSQAVIINLTHNNSFAQINVDSQAGMFNWTVDGQQQLNQQWFWYRVANNLEEFSIDTISPPSITTPDARTLYTRYNNGAYGVEVDYVLTGFSPGSGHSQISESITITNATASPLAFHFFQYSDFEMAGTAGGDNVALGKNNQGLWNEALQTEGNIVLSEIVSQSSTVPGANHAEANFYPNTLTALNDGAVTTLNDNGGPVGPGDVTWAFEWDFTLDPGSSFGISKLKDIQIPEPSALALISLGLGALALRRRGQRVG